MNLKHERIVRAMHLLLVPLLLAVTPSVWAGKYPYPEFERTLVYEVVEVLKRQGMPVKHDRDNPWFAVSSIPGSYTIYLSQAEEIPQEVVLEIVKLCLDFDEQRGRKERFRILMYRETEEERRKSYFLGIGALTNLKPFFELTIGRKE